MAAGAPPMVQPAQWIIRPWAYIVLCVMGGLNRLLEYLYLPVDVGKQTEACVGWPMK